MAHRGPSLGTKLLLASLLLLTLPWLAWRALIAFETFLADGQLRALELQAGGAALLLEPKLGRLGPGPGLGTTTVYAWPLDRDQVFDGYPGEWLALPGEGLRVGAYGPTTKADGFGFRLRLGTRDGWLFGLVEVRDPATSYRNPGQDRFDGADHVRLDWHADDGISRYRVLAPQGPGYVAALPSTPDGTRIKAGAPDLGLEGHWQPAAGGYTLEFRVPIEILVEHPVLRVAVHDADTSSGPGGRLLTTPPLRPRYRDAVLEDLLAGLATGPARTWVVDSEGWVRAGVGGASGLAPAPHRVDRIELPILADALAGTPRSANVRSAGVLVAAVPLRGELGIRGAVLVEQPLDALLRLRYRTFADFVVASLAVLGASALALLLFAARLTWRIRRLGREATASIDARGRQVRAHLEADTHSGDELGELSRAISGLLARLKRHTRFVESLPHTLRHELSNPLNSVATALANLAEEPTAEGRERLLGRAGRGLQRVEKTLTALTEAADLEEALQGDPRTRLDLGNLLRDHLESFGLQHPGRPLEVSLPGDPALIDGADHRIEQLLDKLLDNADDFTPADAAITVKLAREGEGWRLSVENPGPALPEHLTGKLFETLVSGRSRRDGQGTHLGLGLYVVRRIAEAHGGHAGARNLADGEGVAFSVWFPAAQ